MLAALLLTGHKREALQTIKVIVVCECDRFMDRQSDCMIHRAGNSFIFSSFPPFMHGTIRRLVLLIAAPSMVHQFRVSFIRSLSVFLLLIVSLTCRLLQDRHYTPL